MFDTRLSASQEQRLAELYEAHAPAVLRLCRRMLGNPQDAADACQEVFLRAATSSASDSPQQEARAWLLAVARNYCIDQIRRQKRLGTALTRIGTDAKPQVDPESSVVDRDTVDAIFRQLNARERAVLWQTAVEHRPLAEIADRLHLNYMAAGQVVSRARRRASLVAAQVAAIFVVFRLITRRVSPVASGGVSGWGVLAAAVVPIAVLSVQPSSSSAPPRAYGTIQPVPAANHSPATTAGSSIGNTTLRSPAASSLPVTGPLPVPPVGTSSLPIPSGVAGSAGSVTGTLKNVVPSLPAAPLPTPSLPSPPPIR
jgi:RNA polymerase sigma factor (sigma-70 family)